MASKDGELTMEEGDNVYVSGAEETCGTEEIGGEGEERGNGREGNKRRGLVMTTEGGKPRVGDTTTRVKESKGEEKKKKYSWKVTSAKFT